MGEFVLKGAVGFGLLLIWVYLMVFIDWLGPELRKELPARVLFYIAVASWLMGYGAGSLFFDILFR